MLGSDNTKVGIHMSAADTAVRACAAPTLDGHGELKALDRTGTTLHIPQTQTIFVQGEPVDHAYKIVSGVVRLCKHLPDGRRQIAQFLFPGEYFSFVTIGDHGFSAEAVIDVTLLSFPQRQVERLCQEHPHLRVRLFELLSQRVHDIQNHLTMIGRQTAKERVAGFLLLLSQRSSTDGTRITVPMNRQDIADYLSLTMETVSRTLSRLKAAHIVSVPDLHQLELRNVRALHALADG
jgi:CRP/FNR family transcriptional regulator, anaerobic regulatory protein